MAWRQGVNELLSILLSQPPQQMGKQRYPHCVRLGPYLLSLGIILESYLLNLWSWIPTAALNLKMHSLHVVANLNNSRGGACFPTKHVLNLSSKLCFKNHRAVVQTQSQLVTKPMALSRSNMQQQQQAHMGFWRAGQINPISFCKSITWLVDQRIAISHTLSWF